VHPGHRRCPGIQPETPDSVWLPIVGNAGWIAIGRNKRIRYNPVENRLLRQHGVRAIFLTSGREMTSWDRLALIVRYWQAIEASVDEAGPWVKAFDPDRTSRPHDDGSAPLTGGRATLRRAPPAPDVYLTPATGHVVTNWRSTRKPADVNSIIVHSPNTRVPSVAIERIFLRVGGMSRTMQARWRRLAISRYAARTALGIGTVGEVQIRPALGCRDRLLCHGLVRGHPARSRRSDPRGWS